MQGRARNNRGAGPDTARLNRARQMAADYHWYPEDEFQNHMQVVKFDDADEVDDNGQIMFPANQVLIRYGNLARIHFRAPSKGSIHPRRERDTTITLSRPAAAESHLAFDPEGASDNLYMKIKKSCRAPLAQRFWVENNVRPRLLSEWAMLAGGSHARDSYPTVMAKPIGVATALVYYTLKKDDGPRPCFYIHRLGEVSSAIPILACDSTGRLWLCGGSYQSLSPGITD